jgi:hypothetical protein
MVFSAPELKAQVGFSDCLSVCNFFAFLNSSPEPLGKHLNQNWHKSFRGRGIQMKGNTSARENNSEKLKLLSSS